MELPDTTASRKRKMDVVEVLDESDNSPSQIVDLSSDCGNCSPPEKQQKCDDVINITDDAQDLIVIDEIKEPTVESNTENSNSEPIDVDKSNTSNQSEKQQTTTNDDQDFIVIDEVKESTNDPNTENSNSEPIDVDKLNPSNQSEQEQDTAISNDCNGLINKDSSFSNDSEVNDDDQESNVNDNYTEESACEEQQQESQTKPKKEPVMVITFADRKSVELYKSHLVKFFKRFNELRTVDLEEQMQLQCCTIPKCEEIPPRHPNKRKRLKKKDYIDGLFVEDTTPARKSFDYKWKRPMYPQTKFKIDDEPEEEEKTESPSAAANTCFNCNGSHMLKDCPNPKDFQKIAAQRKKVKQKYSAVRYHEDDDSKYGHLKPGKLSDRLRRALGLSRNDIPMHVYKMRIHGYPPGWLEEAKTVHSNLSIIDGEGNEFPNENHNVPTFDFEKIFDYPGFNTRPHRDARDEYEYFGVPAYSSALNKQNMISYLQSMTEQQKQLMALQPKPSPARKIIDKPNGSPSLIDLEAQKEELLSQLGDEDSAGGNSELETVEINEGDPQKVTDKSGSEDVIVTPKKNIKFSVEGTPILKSLSPYARLPNPDNFSKDVAPLLYFENLPNSTGKYEQMSAVLDKVRRSLKGNDKT